MKNKPRIIFALLMLFCVYALAQDSTGTGTAGSATDFASYFLSPVGVVALIVLITGYITTHQITADAVFLGIHIKQWVSYLISFAVCFIGYWKGIGIFHSITAGATVLNAIGFGVAANGTASIPFIQSALTFVAAKKKQ